MPCSSPNMSSGLSTTDIVGISRKPESKSSRVVGVVDNVGIHFIVGPNRRLRRHRPSTRQVSSFRRLANDIAEKDIAMRLDIGGYIILLEGGRPQRRRRLN